jgi:hypothetical protein
MTESVTITDFEVFVEAHPVEPVPCDWSDEMDACGEARWAARFVKCCPKDSCLALLCDGCKDYCLTPGNELECTACGAEMGAQEATISIDPLEGK